MLRFLVTMMLGVLGCGGGSAERGGSPGAATPGAATPAVPSSGIPACEPAACERACTVDHDAACCARAAELYFDGKNGHALDAARSFAFAKQACDAGNLQGCTLLGMQLQDGRGTVWNPREAEAVYERACRLGAGTACYNLGSMYSGGHGVIADQGKADAYMAKAQAAWLVACDGSERRWCTNAAFGLSMNDKSKEVDARRLTLNQRACEAGVSVGCTQAALDRSNLGQLTQAQLLVELDRMCLAEHESGACVTAGARSLIGKYFPKDPQHGLAMIRAACEQGDREGCEAMAEEAMRGELIPRDDAAATRYLAMACERGLARACFELAKAAYQQGDFTGVVTFSQRACEMNEAPACAALGALYYAGEGVAHSDAEGARWTTEGCRGGIGGACASLIQHGITELPVSAARRGEVFARACADGITLACPTGSPAP